MKMFKKLCLFGMMILLVGCGERVTVVTGQVGKELGSKGLSNQTFRPSTFRLTACPFSPCPSLVTLDTFQDTYEFEQKFYNSQSKLDLTISVGIQYEVLDDDANIDIVYGAVKSEELATTRRHISTEKTFHLFVVPSLGDTIREELNNNNIEEIMDNISTARMNVEAAVKEKYDNTPINIISVSFKKISFPEILVEKREQAAAIDSQRIIDLKKAESRAEVLKKIKSVKIQEAELAVTADEIISNSMDEKMATWLMLDAIQTCAARESGDCNITIHPNLIPILKK